MQALRVACLAFACTAGATPPPIAQVELDARVVRETVDAVAHVIEREYFNRDVAAKVSSSLRESLAEGRFSSVKTPEELARSLTASLYAWTDDKHLAVAHVPSDDASSVPQSRASKARRQNFGVEHIQILPGNVGYLNLTFFYRPEEGREAIEAAIASLRHADALIVDMRSNRGGNPGTVALLASYLFEAPEKRLFDIAPRDGETNTYYTESVPARHRDARRPVYVLTAETTFSAGEGLAFILQDFARAKVVGEVTAGAANPGRPYRVNDDFDVVVPNGEVRSGATGRNWEGVGVTPDIRTTAAEALEVAHRHALEELLETTADEIWAETLRRALQSTPP